MGTAQAAQVSLNFYFDTDGIATGNCTVSTPQGVVSGVDQILALTVDDTALTVSADSLSRCDAQSNTFEQIASPVGVWSLTSTVAANLLHGELALPGDVFPTSVVVAAQADDGSFINLLDGSNSDSGSNNGSSGSALPFATLLGLAPSVAATPIPAAPVWALLLLAVAVLAVGAVAHRRKATGLSFVLFASAAVFSSTVAVTPDAWAQTAGITQVQLTVPTPQAIARGGVLSITIRREGQRLIIDIQLSKNDAVAPPAIATSKLNDTGITLSGAASSGNSATCSASDPAGQDCAYGRDAAAAAGTLKKVGGGRAGFDYTKISNSGQSLPDSATLGSGAGDWACTRDNVTGLIWEVKTSDGGLRDQKHTYTWYDSASPDGYPGTASRGTCFASGRCDSEKYTADVNAQGLCGAKDWRMPTQFELMGIVDYGAVNPSIDSTYFPNTQASYFWSGSPSAHDTNYAWNVGFLVGYVYYYYGRGNDYFVRLVRGGQ